MKSLTNPPVRNHPDEVLRRERLKHRNRELDDVLVLGKLAVNRNKQLQYF